MIWSTSMYISTGGPLDFLWNRFLDTPLFVARGPPTEVEVPGVVKSLEIVSEYHYLSLVPRRWTPMKNVVIFSISEDTEEIRALLKTLGMEVTKEFVQNRSRAHRESFLGPGRIEEILKEIKELDVDLIVVNGVLKPSQHHFLEMKFQMECIDRTGVILRIFTDHAHTPEAIAQVTLAKLRYELPFLREWIHKSKSGDRPGFLAGGAYATDVYFEHAKTHARKIEVNLSEVSRQREITRTRRREKGYSLVSLAGYTNAGKSALMNRLCNAGVDVDDRLFSTLSTTTRRISSIKGNILMSDTVGFIRDLPPDLINAFNSTLEEIYDADLILLVFDASEPDELLRIKLNTSLKILLPKVENRSIVVIGNKIDLLSKESRHRVVGLVEPIIQPYDLILVSSVSEEGLDLLRERILRVQGHTCIIEADLPLTDAVYSLLSRLRSSAEVSMTVISRHAAVIVRCKPEDSERIVGWLNAAGATRIIVNSEAQEMSPERETPSSGSEGAPL
jgi:GTP-binding protein HflX